MHVPRAALPHTEIIVLKLILTLFSYCRLYHFACVIKTVSCLTSVLSLVQGQGTFAGHFLFICEAFCKHDVFARTVLGVYFLLISSGLFLLLATSYTIASCWPTSLLNFC